MNCDKSKKNRVLVVGAGLAGVEATSMLIKQGISVLLVDSKRITPNPTQSLEGFAELVCTNSLKSKQAESAHGILKNEMEMLGSIVIRAAYKSEVPAGDALAVDRKAFSELITEELSTSKLVEFVSAEVSNPLEFMNGNGCSTTIIATGPLTTEPLAKWIGENLTESSDDLYFYDAMAPIVDGDSLDMEKLYFKDRYKESDDEVADYLNCPLGKEEYESFISDLVNAKKTPAKDFEKPKFFEGCLPIDLMAERGVDTPRFSCMKPVGLENDNGEIPYAAIQLRKENLLGNAYNLVGFQTRLTYKEQTRIFRTIPGFENANFLKLGSVHRNTYLNAKKLLNSDLSSKKYPEIFFAGQIIGVEGYTESASAGLYAALQVIRKQRGVGSISFPIESAMGALINYIMTVPKPVPSNINFGLFPAPVLSKEQRKNRKLRKMYKKKMVAEKAVKHFTDFLSSIEVSS